MLNPGRGEVRLRQTLWESGCKFEPRCEHAYRDHSMIRIPSPSQLLEHRADECLEFGYLASGCHGLRLGEGRKQTHDGWVVQLGERPHCAIAHQIPIGVVDQERQRPLPRHSAARREREQNALNRAIAEEGSPCVGIGRELLDDEVTPARVNPGDVRRTNDPEEVVGESVEEVSRRVGLAPRAGADERTK